MRKEIQELLEKQVITGAEANQLFGVDESGLRHKVRRGTLKAVKKGDVWLYDIEDLKPRHGTSIVRQIIRDKFIFE